MTQIVLQNVSFGYVETLFRNVNLTITEQDRIGIVANNGEGKSTLLKCITGEISDFDGTVTRPRNLKVGYIEQGVPDQIIDLSLYEAIIDGLHEEEKYSNIWKVDIALEMFGAPEEIRHRPVRNLSGGWQRLALIARVVMSEPDVLILDEPTNHLDIEKIALLETWLNEQVYDIPVLIVSHDRDFLNNCTNRTVFLRTGVVSSYRYSYDEARKLLEEDDKTAQHQRDKELEELARLTKTAHKQRQIGKDNFSDTALQKAKQIERRADALRQELTDVHVEKRRDVKLQPSETHAKLLVRLRDVAVPSPAGDILFHIEKLDIVNNERLVILGPNGAGKSQFLQIVNKAFTTREEAREIGITITPTATLGYIDQHLSSLPSRSTMHEFIREISPETVNDQRIASLLASVGFPYESQQTKIDKLSQGQRSRLNLLALKLISPNFYIMDEPTNHLDISGQEALEQELLNHQAACLLVSHDRAFTNNVGTTFYEIRGRKLVRLEDRTLFGAAVNTQTVRK